MSPDVYQAMSDRTKCSQANALARLVINNGATSTDKMQLLHAVIGLGGEAGELCSLLQKWIWYGKAMTVDEVRLRVLEEFGDVMWYAAEAFNALGISFQEVLEANLRKLKTRYPEKYTDTLAADENRDRAAEDRAMERGEVSDRDVRSSDPDFTPGQWNDQAVEPGDRSGS